MMLVCYNTRNNKGGRLALDDMLSFVSKRIKKTDGTNMKRLIDGCGITKSKFYRYMAEPYRFSDQQIKTMATILALSETETDILFSFKKTSQNSLTEKTGIFHQVRKILFEESPIIENISLRNYTLFSKENGTDIVAEYSARDLAKKIMDILQSTTDIHKNMTYPIKVTIVNSSSLEKTHYVFNFLKAYSEEVKSSNGALLEIDHYINAYGMNIEQRFSLFSQLYPFSAFKNYSIHFDDLSSSPLANTDWFEVEFGEKATGLQKYIFAIIPYEGNMALYMSDDLLLREFVHHKFLRQVTFNDDKKNLTNNLQEIGRSFVDAARKYKKLEISYELCFDNFSPDLWREIGDELVGQKENASRNPEVGEQSHSVNNVLDEYRIRDLVASGEERVLVSEQNEAVNVVSARGIALFAREKCTSEMKTAGAELSNEQVVRELKYIKSRLGKNAKQNQQIYYLIDPLVSIPKITFCIYRNHKIVTFLNDSPLTELSWKFVPDQEISSLFYDCIINEVIPHEQCVQSFPRIMPDERAASFIDELIQAVNEEKGM